MNRRRSKHHINALLSLLSLSALSMAACSGASPTGPAAVSDAPEVVSVTLNVSSWDFYQIGESAQLHAWVNGSSETPKWKSSDPEVAVIDEDGLVTAVGNGIATITVSVGGAFAEALVSVSAPLSTLLDVSVIGR